MIIAIQFSRRNENTLVLVECDWGFELIEQVDRQLPYSLGDYYIENYTYIGPRHSVEAAIDALIARMEAEAY